MNKSIMLCGVGGQGTVLASKLIASAAMKKGMNVLSAETIGMAQKGGSVFSHLRIGDDLHSPIIARGSADIIIGFEPAEAVRMLPYLKEGGCVIVNSAAVMPVTSVLGKCDYTGYEMLDYLKENVKNLTVVDSVRVCEKLGSNRVMNMVMLGAAVKSGALGISADDIKAAIIRTVKPAFHDINLRAIDAAE